MNAASVIDPGQVTVEAGGAPGLQGADRFEELAKASELRDKGILTEEEFQTEKKRILGS